MLFRDTISASLYLSHGKSVGWHFLLLHDRRWYLSFERYDGLSRYCNISLTQPKINFQHSIGSTYELKSSIFFNYIKSLFLRITYTPRMLLLLSFGALLLWQATAAADVILVVAVVDGPRSSADVGINKHVGTSPHSFPHSQQAREDGRYVRIDR